MSWDGSLPLHRGVGQFGNVGYYGRLRLQLTNREETTMTSTKRSSRKSV